ncbi:hypothetical protein [Pseudomonas aeruginosa]|uniref:hypothetical protein n=1 Tax=Pseudomonas aeruginosa TaxID=287 RepID=UPI00292B70C3|nr:hypothetical protein [Pseudomonas aeruginosa]HEC0594877.1 hypothetical protein [Pseudomonas aeruginosa]HEC1330018.1 hypothetical protein [Pseudomonas aeruginosa]HEC1338889.1 hypothetical protein [Pseudomonas aeruginosa]HEC1370950.1 hypothetical protein [Pseudomonas aeruginosa]
MPWISVLIAPAATNTHHYTTRSEALQGLFKDGTQAVVRWYPPDEDECSGRWKTTCSSAWDVTEQITHWRDLFPPSYESMKGFFLEGEQLRCLQSIMQGIYGDGRIVTSDGRRDLANRLHQLIGVIQAQTIEIDV